MTLLLLLLGLLSFVNSSTFCVSLCGSTICLPTFNFVLVIHSQSCLKILFTKEWLSTYAGTSLTKTPSVTSKVFQAPEGGIKPSISKCKKQTLFPWCCGKWTITTCSFSWSPEYKLESWWRSHLYWILGDLRKSTYYSAVTIRQKTSQKQPAQIGANAKQNRHGGVLCLPSIRV